MAYTTIDDGSAYFHTQTWTGTSDDSTKTITNSANAGDFKPDWLWIKARSGNYSTRDHALYDSNRGATKRIESSAADTEATDSNNTFNTNGFTLTSNYSINGPSTNHVGWQWKVNGGSTSSNSDGNITSTVQANTTAGFSIVTFTGNATAGQTVGHGLGVKPQVIFAKNRSNGNNWNCYVEATDNTGDYTLTLNGTGARSNSFNMWNDTAPTSSVITLGDRNETNGSGHNMVFYCFHSIKGYSKISSYKGNGNANGAFVYTGFRAAFILGKHTGSGGNDWIIQDSTRFPTNLVSEYIRANTSDAETDQYDVDIDILSNGFKCRGSSGNINTNDSVHFYMAFAEHPFVSSEGVPVTAR